MKYLILSVAFCFAGSVNAACPQMFGKFDAASSSWYFSAEQQQGMVQVEVDPATCRPYPNALSLNAGKYKNDPAKLATERAKEQAELKKPADAQARLKAIDWSRVTTVDDVKLILQDIVEAQ